MKRIIFGALAIGLALAATGCANNPVWGSGGVRSDQFFGDVGIFGSGKEVTILRGSIVQKLSFLGHNNKITVQDGVSVSKIEFWGKGNTVSIPETLIVRTAEVGDNQIIRRPREVQPRGAARQDGTFAPELPPVEPLPQRRSAPLGEEPDDAPQTAPEDVG